jgi:hypothetical protein
VWGPIEEADWGPAVRDVLARPDAFLGACGQVAVYALGAERLSADEQTQRVNQNALFLDNLLRRKETLCSSDPDADVHVIDEPIVAIPGGPGNATDVAVGQDARQSSTVAANDARFAVDGNTSGDNSKVPIAHTQNERNPWWEVDLTGSHLIQEVQVWNRTDCCQDRLKDFYVLVSDQPFASTKPFPACTQTGVTAYFVSGTLAGPGVSIPVQRGGRYVRVQIPRQDFLALGEVEVWADGSPTMGNP